MLASYNWLQKYIEEPLPNPDKIARKLGENVFEVEDVKTIDDDTVFNIDILPNRAHDSLGHWGLAREIAGQFGLTLKIEDSVVKTKSGLKSSDNIKLLIKDPSACRRALKRLLTDVSVKESPEWLVKQLEAVGQRSINNVVDITNFVMLETGQPVHAFDFDKLSGDGKKEISVRSANDGEVVETLDGYEYSLKEGMTVIADGKKALDIAGIKGGSNSSIDEKTTRLMLSVCSFDPTRNRKTSQSLNLHTDASKRFENDVHPDLSIIAMERLSELLEKHAGASVSEDVIDEYPVIVDTYTHIITVDEVNNLMGTSMGSKEVSESIDKLMFPYSQEGDSFTVEVPYYRGDISIKESMLEEVGRMYGYENIKDTVPTIDFNPKIHSDWYYQRLVRTLLVEEGFSEIYTYTLVSSGDIEILKPLAEDKSFLRTDLASGVLMSIESNRRNSPLLGLGKLSVFELGRVFTSKKESTHLCVVISDTDSEKDDLKIALSTLIDKTGKALSLKIATDSVYDKGTNSVYAEIDLDELFGGVSHDIKTYSPIRYTLGSKYSEISNYPFVLRDIALWVSHEVGSASVEDIIRKSSGDLLARSDLFDEFEKDGRVSYAFHLVFQSNEKTLTDEEVNSVMKEVEEALTDKGYEIR